MLLYGVENIVGFRRRCRALTTRAPGSSFMHSFLAHDGKNLGLHALNTFFDCNVLASVGFLAHAIQGPPRTHNRQGQRDRNGEVDP